MEVNTINALDAAAGSLAQQIAFCRTNAERCLDIAWAQQTHIDDKHHYFRQMESFMRVSVELAGALAKLKGDPNTHRQLISVERVERIAPALAKGEAAAAPAPIREDATNSGGTDVAAAEAQALENAERVEAADTYAAEPVEPLEAERLRRREWHAMTLAQNRAGIAARQRRESEARVARIMADAVPTAEDYAEADADWAARNPVTEARGGRGGRENN